MSAADDDFPSNIDEQLLNSVDPHHSTRLKLEEIDNTSHLNDSKHQHNNQSQLTNPYQTSSNPQESTSRSRRVNHHQQQHSQIHQNPDDYRKFQIPPQLQQDPDQYARQHEQAQQHAQQQATAAGINNYTHPHHQQQPQQQQQQQLELTGPTAEELSEYNIQIPDPIIDAKSKIYPVTENTITAEGYLITRPYPEQVFSNREDLNEFIAEFARDNGFGVVIAHSNRKAIYYTCELGGRYRHKKSKKIDVSKQIDVGDGYMLDPDTKTKKLKCPFAMTASFRKVTGMWTLRTTCNEHNHPQLDPLSNHPMLRKRSDELNLLILDLYKLGTKPSHIESKIKEQYPDVLIKREDIYNEIRGYKRKLKKQSSRFGFNNPSRIANAQYRKKAEQQAAAAAAAAAAASSATNGVTTNENNGANVNNNSGNQNNDSDAVAAVAAAASANAFLNDGQDLQQYDNYQNHQQHHHQQQQQQQNHHQLQQQQQQVQQQHQSQQLPQQTQQQQQQQQQEEFQRQFVAATQAQQHQLDEQQYQQYQQQLHHHHNLNDDGSAAAAIAAVTNVGRHANHYQDNGDLSMDNIDSRLVGE